MMTRSIGLAIAVGVGLAMPLVQACGGDDDGDGTVSRPELGTYDVSFECLARCDVEWPEFALADQMQVLADTGTCTRDGLTIHFGLDDDYELACGQLEGDACMRVTHVGSADFELCAAGGILVDESMVTSFSGTGEPMTFAVEASYRGP